MTDRLRTVLAALVLAAPLIAHAHGKAHQHGVAQLDIASDPGKLEVQLETPLDNLLGFERAPRNDAERQRADAVVARLKDGAALIRIDPAAACTLASVEIVSAPLGLGAAPAAKGAKDAEHADLEARWSFNCTGTPAGFVEVGLFEAFPRLKTLNVQAATAKGQARRSLKAPANRIELRR